MRIKLFGKLSVEAEGGLPIRIEPIKVQELFCYLVLYRDRPHARESLAELLWGDYPGAVSKKNLRQGLWMLRSAIAPLTEHEILLAVDDEWVQIDSRELFYVDVTDFEQIYFSAQSLPAASISETTAGDLRRAIGLYHRGLLEGWYQEWCIFEREKLHVMALSIHNKLMGYCEVNAQYEEGIALGQQALRLDPACERSHAQLMRLLYLAGDRTEALRQYERCASALRQELNVLPSHYTQLLYQQIQADQIDHSPLNGHLPSQVITPDSLSLPEVLTRLSNFRNSLDAIQNQLQKQIQLIERILGNGENH